MENNADCLPITSEQNEINNSGKGDIFDEKYTVPGKIIGWNWGAFLGVVIWSIVNRVWFGLLILVFASTPVVGSFLSLTFAIYFGFKGNEFAWKSRRWSSIQSFKRTQRILTIVILSFWVLSIIFLMLFILSYL